MTLVRKLYHTEKLFLLTIIQILQAVDYTRTKTYRVYLQQKQISI